MGWQPVHSPREGGRQGQEKNTWIVLTCSHLPAEATLCKTECSQIREIRELSKGRRAAAASGRLEGKTAPPQPQQVQSQRSAAQLAKPAHHPLPTFPRPQVAGHSARSTHALCKELAHTLGVSASFTPPAALCSPSALHTKY